MQFYKHHLGDYDGSTAHLSWDEDMAYTRLMRSYYRREKPIPDADKYRLVRALGKNQKAAVDIVLGEFFTLEADGWHNKRCDEEIAAYQAQASTNKRIAQQRIINESLRKKAQEIANESLNESCTNGSPEYIGEREPNQEPRTKNQEPEKTDKEKQRARKKPASALPVDFGQNWSPSMQDWLEKHANGQTKAYLVYFTGYVKANGKQYVDWEQAFQNCVRDDWPHIRREFLYEMP